MLSHLGPSGQALGATTGLADQRVIAERVARQPISNCPSGFFGDVADVRRGHLDTLRKARCRFAADKRVTWEEAAGIRSL
jgi:hypothetical protein